MQLPNERQNEQPPRRSQRIQIQNQVGNRAAQWQEETTQQRLERQRQIQERSNEVFRENFAQAIADAGNNWRLRVFIAQNDALITNQIPNPDWMRRPEEGGTVVSNQQIDFLATIMRDCKRTKANFKRELGRELENPEFREALGNYDRGIEFIGRLIEILDNVDDRENLRPAFINEQHLLERPSEELVNSLREVLRNDIGSNIYLVPQENIEENLQINQQNARTNLCIVMSRIMLQSLECACACLLVKNENEENNRFFFWCCNIRSASIGSDVRDINTNYTQYARRIFADFRDLTQLNNEQRQEERGEVEGRILGRLLKKAFWKDKRKASSHSLQIIGRLNRNGAEFFGNFLNQLHQQIPDNYNQFIDDEWNEDQVIALINSRQQFINYLQQNNLVDDAFFVPLINVHDVKVLANGLITDQWQVISRVISGNYNHDQRTDGRNLDFYVRNDSGKHAEQAMLERIASISNSNPIEFFTNNTYFGISKKPCLHCWLIIFSSEQIAHQARGGESRIITRQYRTGSGQRIHRMRFGNSYRIPPLNNQNEDAQVTEQISRRFQNHCNVLQNRLNEIKHLSNMFDNIRGNDHRHNEIPQNEDVEQGGAVWEQLFGAREDLVEQTTIRQDVGDLRPNFPISYPIRGD